MDHKTKITVYSPELAGRPLYTHLKEVVDELPASHELGLRLFKRNMKAQYRQSILGFSWALIPPFITAVLWIFLQKNGVMQINSEGSSYPLFVITGTILWQIFSESVWAPVRILNENKSMISKINLPREGLLLSGIYEIVFGLVIKAVIILLMLVFFSNPISLSGLTLASIGVVGIVLLGFSLGIILTPISLLFGDVQRGIAVLMPFIMYISPIVYAAPKEGKIAKIMEFNPLNTFVPFARNWIMNLPTDSTTSFWLVLIVFVLVFLISLVYYRISMPMVIERIGS
jgi:lipopolysaccharide transport system permease protein